MLRSLAEHCSDSIAEGAFDQPSESGDIGAKTDLGHDDL